MNPLRIVLHKTVIELDRPTTFSASQVTFMSHCKTALMSNAVQTRQTEAAIRVLGLLATYLWPASGHQRVALTHSLSHKPILNITSTTERAFIFMSCARTRLGCAVPSFDIFDLTLTYYRDWIIGLTMVREWTTNILVLSFICCVYEIINYTSIGMLY